MDPAEISAASGSESLTSTPPNIQLNTLRRNGSGTGKNIPADTNIALTGTGAKAKTGSSNASDAARPGRRPVEPVGAHRAERCWHIGRLADLRKLRHGGLVDAQEMRAGSLTLEVSDVVARHYSTVTDFARLRGLSTS